MPRYVTRPKAEADCDGWDSAPLITNLEVSESNPIDTGVLDGAGNTIWRINDPIGFQFD